MNITNYIKTYFKRSSSKKKKIYIDRLAYSLKSTFEGKNSIGRLCEIINSEIGFGTYLGNNVKLINSYIGRYCSIANDIRINMGQHPTNTFVSTSPAFYSLDNNQMKKLSLSYTNKVKHLENRYTENNYSLEVGNDVWIGNDVRFIEGIIVNDGAIVASGSLVTKDVPAYSIVAGVPAKVIKYRFNNTEIDFLLKLKWWNKKEEWIIKNAEYFDDINKFMEFVKNEKNN
ncbi:CatB-related O-acetyltransferase [Aquibacillus rhizosphaerae]|uniref:CatB-related O-acetyltransferase n=1 Tax=Aquibacillus rhizosphaerae TaxID=3051431 RepID=A0ABT7KZP4_9BACI|nr:CatB-related O-acetyltransferase [Aquibacillus sp. LR5S19]MDL4838958.1 CatB-related O-acetyltransferase [Aquibacillus sp. LR5S19]